MASPIARPMPPANGRGTARWRRFPLKPALLGAAATPTPPGAVEGPRMERVLAHEAAIKGTTRDAIYEGYASGTSMRSFITAEDIGAMAVFLASDAARLVSGQIIAVDGHTENPDPKV